MELNHLRTFYAVAREGGFTRAAQVLRVQQPAVSKSINLLEESLGILLLERSRTGIRLTQAGTLIYQCCEKIFSGVEEIQVIASAEKKECKGPLLFAATEMVAVYLIPQMLKSFLKEYQEVQPRFFAGNSAQICDELLDGKADFGMFYTKIEDERFVISDLAKVPVALVVAAKFRKNPEVMKSYVSARTQDYPKSIVEREIRILGGFGLKYPPKIETNNYDAQKQAVLSGLGCSILPLYMIQDEVKKGTMHVIATPPDLAYTLRLVIRRNAVLSRNSRVFLDYFRSEISKLVSS
ncbi:LysR family transcriptional regulator [Bdellovibrionota bacterium FG-2]